MKGLKQTVRAILIGTGLAACSAVCGAPPQAGVADPPSTSGDRMTAEPALAQSGVSTSDRRATFLVSDKRFHGDPEVFWPGFLSGLRGFEHFYEPIGQPLYFESPFINTSARLLYLHHEFADDSQLQGGHLDVLAAQARVAITERLAFIATKDGYDWLRAGALPEEEGWNDLAFGLKYAVIVSREHDFVLTPGFRYQMGNGDGGVLQGGSQEFSPFVSFGKGFDDLHFIGNLTFRVPTDDDKGNNIFQWDAHFDYDLGAIGLKGVAPVLEIHGLHYLTDGTRTGLKVGGLDYTNLGSTDVAGSTVVWMGVGARVKFSPNFSMGATYEFALTNRNADIMDERVTLDFLVTW